MAIMMKTSRRTAALLAGASLLCALGVSTSTFAADAAKAPAVYREFVQGNPNAKVVVIEYASLTCPHCAHFQQVEFPRLKEN